ncbi:hypothetical protein PF004_g7287 [Phytophthora fragariae]|uniref:Uncharacterized protein n=1 Tax=Phytophthora fragariae TaxID=53985 RepID=A0A6G0PAI1_9STRA|nr:hypothetical protein PF004_g7287 [Phytophthora fragariae]
MYMTNFAPGEFERLWVFVREHIMVNWNMGRERKCADQGKQVLLMMLTVLRHRSRVRLGE